jgi:hypothetical protein
VTVLTSLSRDLNFEQEQISQYGDMITGRTISLVFQPGTGFFASSSTMCSMIFNRRAMEFPFQELKRQSLITAVHTLQRLRTRGFYLSLLYFFMVLSNGCRVSFRGDKESGV